MTSDPGWIRIVGARQHNLKNLTLSLPKNQLVVITGVSGSGKSSLAFDTLYAEGQRRDVESLSAYARQFLERLEKPDVDSIEGLSPAIAIEQRTSAPNPRSTVATTRRSTITCGFFTPPAGSRTTRPPASRSSAKPSRRSPPN